MANFRMSKHERQAFLASLHVGIVAIAETGRGPLAVPVWYAYEPGGELWFVTDRDARKAQLLTSASRISLCAQDESPPYKYVSVEGPIVEIRPADRERDARPIARRYLGEKRGDRYVERGGDGGDSVRISMRPERWYAIDYGKAGK